MLAFLLYRLSCGLLRLLVRAGLDDTELEIAVLRHQLRVLTRGGKRPRHSTADRAFLAAASRFLPKERWSAFGVVPDTLKRWRRQLEAGKARRPRRGPGRPPIEEETLRQAERTPTIPIASTMPRLCRSRISGWAPTIGLVIPTSIDALATPQRSI